MRFTTHEFRPGIWHVLDDGHPIYDGAPDGQDKPQIFRDQDDAEECAERLNNEANKNHE